MGVFGMDLDISYSRKKLVNIYLNKFYKLIICNCVYTFIVL